ncbi:MAG TPA: esterase-like activity of phytase family protein [Vicinamibacterales bacterium]|nr:esterase-like activity of phytase family protein [Vicinamibacterales bacterium]
MRPILLASAALAGVAQLLFAPDALLTGYAVLPADTFAGGPPGGVFRNAGARDAAGAFPAQPVQGISSIWPADDGTEPDGGWYWALTDNGYGTKINSPDYLLRIYRVRPRFETRSVEVAPEFVQLRDPDRRAPFHIVHENTSDRALTGADFDPESFVLMPDGTFWIGDEFGPFLLHVAADGRLLDPPFAAEGVRSPDHPLLPPPDAGEASEATVARSRGFEGLAYHAPRKTLIALLEAGLVSDQGKISRALEFDPAARSFTGRGWQVPLEAPDHALTELVAVSPVADGRPDYIVRFMAIERDSGHGPEARFKKIFYLDLTNQPQVGGGRHSIVQKHGRGPSPSALIDLLSIVDPNRLATGDGRFSFPFITPEALWPLGMEVLIVNDNNYPATGGRTPEQRDNTEFVRLRPQ